LFERLVGVRSVRPWGRVLLVAFAAGYLAACTEVVDSAVESRYAQYNYSVDWAKNEAILLNIARASEYQPLNFMSFQPYQGTASVSGTAAAPSFIIGPDRIASQKQYSISNSTLTATASGTGTVTVTSLDTQGFYASVMAPVEFTDLNAFQRQGYPRELLFRLFADYVSIKPLKGDPLGHLASIVYNDPHLERQCAQLRDEIVKQLYPNGADELQRRICFNDLVEFALLSGLSSEVRTIANSASGGKASAGANKTSTTDSTSDSSAPKTTTEGRLCFDPALANREYNEYEKRGFPQSIRNPPALLTAEYHPVCGGTTGLDQWIDTTKKTTPPAGNAVANKAAANAQKDATDAATTASKSAAAAVTAAAAEKTATDKTAAAAQTVAAQDRAVADKATADTKAADAQKASALAAATAKANPVPSATKAPGAKPSPGVETLSVTIKIKTGDPIWDIHSLGANSVEIGTRSTFSIYNFLGRLLRDQQNASNVLLGPGVEDEDRYVLTVIKGQPVGCFANALFELTAYCVPTDGAGNTKRTFSILSQLLALKTTTGDLQLLPTIRLLPTD
jgi:hypothetical protein